MWYVFLPIQLAESRVWFYIVKVTRIVPACRTQVHVNMHGSRFLLLEGVNRLIKIVKKSAEWQVNSNLRLVKKWKDFIPVVLRDIESSGAVQGVNFASFRASFNDLCCCFITTASRRKALRFFDWEKPFWKQKCLTN